MNMKKLVAVLLAFAMCFCLVACGGEKEPAGETKVIKIGILEPQTGSSSFVGNSQISGIKAALDDWVSHYGNPGGYEIELVIGDSQGNADVGVTEAERLITSENCQAIIGTYNSGVAAAVAPICIKYEVPFMVVNAVADNILQNESSFVFRANVGDTVSANNGKAYNYWMDEQLGGRKMFYIYDSGDWGLSSMQSNIDTWTKWGAPWVDDIIACEAVDSDISDFSAILTKIKNSDCNYISTALYFDAAVLLTRQLKEQGMNILVTGAGGLMSADFLPAVGTDADYFLVSGSWVYDPTALPQEALDVEQKFLAENKEAVSVDEAFANGWLGMYCLLHGIENAASGNAVDIAAACDALDIVRTPEERTFLFHPTMERVKFEDEMGVAGFMVYNQNWYATSCYCQVQNGAYTTIYPYEGTSRFIANPPAWSDR